MQIYEITQKPQINEIAGFAQGLAQAAGSMATAAAQKFTQSQGINLDKDTATVAGPQRQAAAGQMSKALLKPLADRMQKGWATALQKIMTKTVDPISKMPVTHPNKIRDDVLSKELFSYLNAMSGTDLTKIGDLDDGSGQAGLLQKEINDYVSNTVRASKNQLTTKPQLDSIWMSLATAVQRARSVQQFASQETKAATVTRAPDGSYRFDNQPYNKLNPAHALAVRSRGQDPNYFNPATFRI